MEEPQIQELLSFFKALADSNRLKIVGLLAQQPRSVEQLAARAREQWCVRSEPRSPGEFRPVSRQQVIDLSARDALTRMRLPARPRKYSDCIEDSARRVVKHPWRACANPIFSSVLRKYHAN